MILVLLVCVPVAAIAPRVYMFNRCGEPGASRCPDRETEYGRGDTLARSNVCQDSGYLCEGLLPLNNEVARWSLAKGVLRVRLPLPDYLPEDVAHETRGAAIEGITQWGGHPFRIDVDTSRVPTRRWDVEIVWTDRLNSNNGGNQGLAHWDFGYAKREFSVSALSILTTTQDQPGTAGNLKVVRITAAHEMGHALGLQHSGHEDDIMYPVNTCGCDRISWRDLKSVDALYRLPIGAVLR